MKSAILASADYMIEIVKSVLPLISHNLLKSIDASACFFFPLLNTKRSPNKVKSSPFQSRAENILLSRKNLSNQIFAFIM